jgi:SAM-dependent methyltransferase
VPDPDVDAVRREALGYYQDFSFQVGLRDWLYPNARHERLKLLLDQLLAGRRGLQVLDVGCGAGVMTAHLRRFGTVRGIDFSEPALALARIHVPDAAFSSESLAEMREEARPFDLVTLFDVLEHIPTEDQPSFLEEAASLLSPAGVLIISTPHPSYTRWLRAHRPDVLQVVDEVIEPLDLVNRAEGLGIELVRYETYDIDGRRQYQLFVFQRTAAPGGAPVWEESLRRRLLVRRNRLSRAVRRARLAARWLRAGRPSAALWVLRPQGGPPKSLRESVFGSSENR